jgi:hypothetical protein
MEHPGADDDVERTGAQARRAEVRLDEEDVLHAVAGGGRVRQLERGTREIRAHHGAVRAREEEAELARAAAELEHARVARDRLVEPPSEDAA